MSPNEDILLRRKLKPGEEVTSSTAHSTFVKTSQGSPAFPAPCVGFLQLDKLRETFQEMDRAATLPPFKQLLSTLDCSLPHPSFLETGEVVTLAAACFQQRALPPAVGI